MKPSKPKTTSLGCRVSGCAQRPVLLGVRDTETAKIEAFHCLSHGRFRRIWPKEDEE